jgi:RNA polymerase sigma-32 factor
MAPPIFPLDEAGLGRYLDRIKRFPMLSREQEYALARSWRERGDRQAAHQLATSHLRLVAKVAMRYRGYGLPMSEVVSEGNVGLTQAVDRFEPERGFRLATYALWWIQASIREYILRSWSLVRIGTTANQRKLFFNLRRVKNQISAFDQGDLRPDQVKQIAARLGVGEQEVVEMNRRLGGDASLNTPLHESSGGEWQDLLVAEEDDQEHKLIEFDEASSRHHALIVALDVLNPRERRVLEARRLADDPMTLKGLAAEVGVSGQRIQQIELRAFKKLQGAVRAAYAERELGRTTLPA